MGRGYNSGGEAWPRGGKGWGDVGGGRQEGPSHPLLEFGLLLQRHGVSLGYDGDDVHHFAEVFHELQVKRSQAGAREGGVSGPPCPPPLRTGGLGPWLRPGLCSLSPHLQNKPDSAHTRSTLRPALQALPLPKPPQTTPRGISSGLGQRWSHSPRGSLRHGYLVYLVSTGLLSGGQRDPAPSLAKDPAPPRPPHPAPVYSPGGLLSQAACCLADPEPRF